MTPFPCKHWKELGKPKGGGCAIEVHPGRISFGTCMECDKYEGPERTEQMLVQIKVDRGVSTGLGDTIRKVTDATGISTVVHAVAPDCKCPERQALLNKLFPYHG